MAAARRSREAWLRRQYATGRGTPVARRLSAMWARAFALGVFPRRWVCLEVRGRRTGLTRRFPIGLADLDGQWYAVSMLGECAWTRNVRAAQGQVVVRRRGAHRVHLVEVPVGQRPAIIKAYLGAVPGGRPHIPVDYREPVAAFTAVAGRIPVFTVLGDLEPPT